MYTTKQRLKKKKKKEVKIKTYKIGPKNIFGKKISATELL
jgi:predicted transcriptional regulator of viral defense system